MVRDDGGAPPPRDGRLELASYLRRSHALCSPHGEGAGTAARGQASAELVKRY